MSYAAFLREYPHRIALREIGNGFKGKEPIANGWQTSTLTEDDVPGRYGIPCGRPLRDGYLVVIDVDSAPDLAILEQRYGKLPTTLSVATGQGTHLYFISRRPCGNSTPWDKTIAVDVRGLGGQVVGAGQQHHSGAHYNANTAEIAYLPETWPLLPPGAQRERGAVSALPVSPTLGQIKMAARLLAPSQAAWFVALASGQVMPGFEKGKKTHATMLSLALAMVDVWGPGLDLEPLEDMLSVSWPSYLKNRADFARALAGAAASFQGQPLLAGPMPKVELAPAAQERELPSGSDLRSRAVQKGTPKDRALVIQAIASGRQVDPGEAAYVLLWAFPGLAPDQAQQLCPAIELSHCAAATLRLSEESAAAHLAATEAEEAKTLKAAEKRAKEAAKKQAAESAAARAAKFTAEGLDLRLDSKGRPVDGMGNIAKILRARVQVQVHVRGRDATIGWDGEAAEHIGPTHIAEQIDLAYEMPVRPGVIKGWLEEAVLNTANEYDPIVGYLQAAKWDGRARLDSWLDAFVAQPTSYTRAVGRYLILAAVARTVAPGCHLGYTPVLIGDEGTGKSGMLNALCAGLDGTRFGQRSRFAGQPTNGMEGKDLILARHKALIYEDAEAVNHSQREAEQSRADLSAETDLVRPPYAARALLIPRRFVTVITTNHKQIHGDREGRRYAPVHLKRYLLANGNPDIKRRSREVGSMLEQLHSEATQIWAEAVAVFAVEGLRALECLRAGEVADQLAAEQSDARESGEEDIVAENIERALTQATEGKGLPLADTASADRYGRGQVVSLTALAEVALGMSKADAMRAARKIGKVMSRLGWRRVHTGTARVWLAPGVKA
jgi:hypothetical protein